MLFLVITLVVVPLVALVPAFVVSRLKPERESWMLPFVHVPAVTLWLALVVLGYGPQSLGNLGEGFAIGGVAVACGYAKVLLVDRFTAKHAATSYGLAALLALLAVGLRAFMPVIPE